MCVREREGEKERENVCHSDMYFVFVCKKVIKERTERERGEIQGLVSVWVCISVWEESIRAQSESHFEHTTARCKKHGVKDFSPLKRLISSAHASRWRKQESL